MCLYPCLLFPDWGLLPSPADRVHAGFTGFGAQHPRQRSGRMMQDSKRAVLRWWHCLGSSGPSSKVRKLRLVPCSAANQAMPRAARRHELCRYTMTGKAILCTVMRHACMTRKATRSAFSAAQAYHYERAILPECSPLLPWGNLARMGAAVCSLLVWGVVCCCWVV